VVFYNLVLKVFVINQVFEKAPKSGFFRFFDDWLPWDLFIYSCWLLVACCCIFFLQQIDIPLLFTFIQIYAHNTLKQLKCGDCGEACICQEQPACTPCAAAAVGG
jgi:hypothetical protein